MVSLPTNALENDPDNSLVVPAGRRSGTLILIENGNWVSESGNRPSPDKWTLRPVHKRGFPGPNAGTKRPTIDLSLPFSAKVTQDRPFRAQRGFVMVESKMLSVRRRGFKRKSGMQHVLGRNVATRQLNTSRRGCRGLL